jgi:hypothetical protein
MHVYQLKKRSFYLNDNNIHTNFISTLIYSSRIKTSLLPDLYTVGFYGGKSRENHLFRLYFLKISF